MARMPNAMENDAPRILIVRVGAMGDVLHGLPAAAMLRSSFPHAYLGWAVEPRWAPLLQARPDAAAGSQEMPLVDCVHPVETRLWSKRPFSLSTAGSILALRRGMRQRRYDMAIDLQGSIRSAVIARLSGAARIAGSASPRESPARLLYTDRIVPTFPHVIQQAVEFAAAAAALRDDRSFSGGASQISTEEGSRMQAPLPIDEAAERWCDTVLGEVEEPFVVLAPTAGWGAKQWPAERYGKVAAALASRGYRILLNLSPPLPDAVAAEVIAAAKLAGTVDRIQPLTSTIPQLIALLRRAALVVAGDTGPLHLAAALGRPVVAIFGPTDPARNGPFGTRAIILRDPSSVTDHRRHAAPEAGLLRIPTQQVLDAALKLLERGERATGSVHIAGTA